MSKKILVVEDDKRINEIICDYLEIAGLSYITVYNGLDAMEQFNENRIDLVILDIMLPKLDGYTVCRKIREKSDALIIILSARGQEDDKLLGFELGADEYVTKPFSPKVLVARVKALLNRLDTAENNNIIKYDGLEIDKQAYKVVVDGEAIHLTSKEFAILIKLISNKSIVLTRDNILKSIWGLDYYGDGRVIDTNIKTLRKKLGHYSKFIKTVIGVGYKFEV